MSSEELMIASLIILGVGLPTGLILWMLYISENFDEQPQINSQVPDNL